MTLEIGAGVLAPVISETDYATMPPAVIEDATALAGKIVGAGQERYREFINQLLATYLAARGCDVALVFNSGGWGWNRLEETPGWTSIIAGIQVELERLGHSSLVMNYRRTGGGFRSCLYEFKEGWAVYKVKGRELAGRIEFLTRHLPDLKVVLTGESNGTAIADATANRLRDNPRVFSILTGTPYWHESRPTPRTLLMNSNGHTVDTFSQGNFLAMLWASLKVSLGIMSPEENPGTVLSWLRAPGHHYSWEYPGVCAEVTRFLEKNFAAG